MRIRSFAGGIHPRETLGGKRVTGVMPVVNAQPPATVAISLSQHVGAPCKPIVKPGQHVLMGQKVGEPAGYMGAPVHSSVSGVVKGIKPRTVASGARVDCVIIENDGLDTKVDGLNIIEDPMTADRDVLLNAIREAGIVGLGGAAFPTQVKLSPPKDKKIEYLLLNGAECEPYLTADHRNMLENADRIVDGLRLILRATGVKRGVIAIEDNKPDAIEVMRKAAEGREGIEVLPLKTKYPQGGEKQLIEVVTGRQVPRGKLPADAGALVFNVSTAAAIADAITLGKPLVERITTVTGCVKEPSNLRLRVGTQYSEAIAACGGLTEEAAKIFAGGPMTGLCAPNDTISMTKATNGIVVFSKEQAKAIEEGPCIRCGRCVEACPIHLMPYQLKYDCEAAAADRAKSHGLMDCVACGACSFVCPARRHLTASFKAMKEEIAAKARRR